MRHGNVQLSRIFLCKKKRRKENNEEKLLNSTALIQQNSFMQYNQRNSSLFHRFKQILKQLKYIDEKIILITKISKRKHT